MIATGRRKLEDVQEEVRWRRWRQARPRCAASRQAAAEAGQAPAPKTCRCRHPSPRIEAHQQSRQIRLRHHRHRRRSRRICGRHSRGATQETRPLRREGKPRRHLPELGLHPDQGAARRRRVRPQDAHRSRPTTAFRSTTSRSISPRSSAAAGRSPTSCPRASAPVQQVRSEAAKWASARLLAPHKVKITTQGRREGSHRRSHHHRRRRQGHAAAGRCSSTARRSSPAAKR